MMKYDPEAWIESTIRVLKEYLEQEFQVSVDDGQDFVGLDAYEIIAEFPGTLLDARKMPMQRTIVHFEIDDIQSNIVGFGDNVFSSTLSLDGMLTGRTGEVHLINFDVGIWASDASGGTTARMRAKQILQSALGGARGITRLRDFSDNGDGMLEIMGFSGGRFMADRIGDMTVHRMSDSTLVIRVYSRDPLAPDMTGPAIMEIDQDPEFWIEEGGNLVPVKP